MRVKLIGALGFVLIACGPPSRSTTQNRARRRVAHIQTSTSREDRSRCDISQRGRAASEYDTNGDGVPDVRKVYQTLGEGTEVHSILVCREVDLNHDGTKDLFRFYNDEGRSLREEEDRNFDGRVDVITYFDAGEVVRREFDSNGDGFVDMRTYYRERRPYRAERNVSGAQSAEFRADYWEFYDSRGRVVRIGWDYDHDGRADRWDRVDRIAPLRGGATANANASTPPPAPATPGASAGDSGNTQGAAMPTPPAPPSGAANGSAAGNVRLEGSATGSADGRTR